MREKVVWKCGNPLCGKLIYFDQDHHGDGKYCDGDCAIEGRRFNQRKKVSVNNIGKYNESRFSQMVFPHKTLPIVLILN